MEAWFLEYSSSFCGSSMGHDIYFNCIDKNATNNHDNNIQSVLDYL